MPLFTTWASDSLDSAALESLVAQRTELAPTPFSTVLSATSRGNPAESPTIIIVSRLCDERDWTTIIQPLTNHHPVLALVDDASARLVPLVAVESARAILMASEVSARISEALDTLLEEGAYLSPRASSVLLTRLAAKALDWSVLDCWSLTQQERRVIAALLEGSSNNQIASTLRISPNTVKFHLENIYRKLGVTTNCTPSSRFWRSAARADLRPTPHLRGNVLVTQLRRREGSALYTWLGTETVRPPLEITRPSWSTSRTRCRCGQQEEEVHHGTTLRIWS